MTHQQVLWATEHDWFYAAEMFESGNWQVWVKENGELHPWPFRDFKELRAWAGY